MINFSSGKCSADMKDTELEPLVMGFITLQYTYTHLISEAVVGPQYGKACVFWCTPCTVHPFCFSEVLHCSELLLMNCCRVRGPKPGGAAMD